ncbi:MAG: sigma-70 family RNA polymerase sigma factor [Solirubrobacteraceae bacterium]
MSSTQQRSVEATRERLIESHLPLVKAVATRYAGRGADLDDLVQVGSIGLIKAADRFDPERGTAFAIFAAPTIEGEIRHHLRDRAAPVRIPRRLQELAQQLRRCRGELTVRLGRAPTVTELAAAVAADEADVERALAAERARDVVAVSADDQPPGRVAREPFGESEDRISLASRLRALDERERRIVYLRFHADMTERRIAKELGISQAHVSRLLAGALQKLRETPSAPDAAKTRRDITSDAVISPGKATFQNRIGTVSGPPDQATLARYLDLPYQVTVKADPSGARASWTARVDELPGCSASGDTPDDAVAHLRSAMEAWVAAAITADHEIPAPAAAPSKPKPSSSHSGRFLVRMPGPLHEQLALAAERRQISLNRFVTDVLAAAVCDETADAPSRAQPSANERTTGSDEGDQPRARTFRMALAANLVVVVTTGVVAIVLLVLALQRGI